LLKARLALILLLATSISRATAATYPSLQISPSSLTLDAAHTIGQVTMNSLSAQNVVFDLQTVSWRQEGDKDEFTPTTAIAVVPPVYEIAAFRAMLVRVGLQQTPGDLKTESAFQIRFREVVPSGPTAEARTLVAPVFVTPSERTGDVRYALTRSGSLQAVLRIEDDANVHAYLGRITIRSGENVAYSGTLDEYVLSGNSREFRLTLDHQIEGTTAELVIKNGDQEQTISAPVR
jgi:P pilus assembly chaperone PapD